MEVFALGICLAMCGVFIWLYTLGRVVLYDFSNYLDAARGIYTYFYYANWILPVYSLFEKLPFYPAYLLWSVLNLLAVLFAARVFGGNSVLVILSYQMLYSLYYGQITGILVGGLALFWWAAASRKYALAGLGLLIAGTKFQSGLMFAGLLWLFAEIGWKDRWKTLLVPAAGFALSMLLDPGWPLALLERIQTNPANADGSLSLWRWFGGWSLLLFLPALLLKTPRWTRFLLLYSAIPLAQLYFQQADILGLLVLPVGWLVVLSGNLGFAYLKLGPAALQWLFIVPLGLYTWVLGKYIYQTWVTKRTHLAADLEKPA